MISFGEREWNRSRGGRAIGLNYIETTGMVPNVKLVSGLKMKNNNNQKTYTYLGCDS